jgi:hypothetical protein
MASTILLHVALFSILMTSVVNASWRMVANTLVTARVDPLISPNKVSGVRDLLFILARCLLVDHSMSMTTLEGTILASITTTTIKCKVPARLYRFKLTRVGIGCRQRTTSVEMARSNFSSLLTWSIIFIVEPSRKPFLQASGWLQDPPRRAPQHLVIPRTRLSTFTV